jgi:epoxyqueuosine reductase
MNVTHVTQQIKEQARVLGFDLVGITPLGSPAHGPAFGDWLAAGYHGEMAYLPARAAQRLDPASLAPGARSLIMLVVNYNPGPPPLEWEDPTHGRIARYAWAADYHDVIKSRLYELDAIIRHATGRSVLGKACVDSAPLLERDFAMAAGLGFAGRNTCLITPKLGSWTLLAALLAPEELEYDVAVQEPPAGPEAEGPPPAPVAGPLDEPDRALPSVTEGDRVLAPGPVWSLQTGKGTCGACRRCLVACPTHAFAAPYVLDSRRCISYLTIELRGPIPRELRPLMGNWVFGCDVCQEACPYNRDVPPSAQSAWRSDPGVAAPPLLELLALDEQAFRARYRGTPVLRARRRGLVRNACIAAGNCAAWRQDAEERGASRDAEGARAAVRTLGRLLADPEPLVRGHAAWALGSLGGPAAQKALKGALADEVDPWVREELQVALS